jgi:small conductance mechanosensitive channel
VGLALGAGGATLASDILAGIFLAQDKDFNVGDEISAGEKPTEGILESMDMRRIRVRDKDGRLHVIPNSIIERKEWVVLTKKRDLK